MKKNLFIPYELSILAQKKGFNEYCIGYYYKRRDSGDIHGLDTFYIDTNQNIQQWNELEEPTEAILYQQIIDWLRINHRIEVSSPCKKDKDLGVFYGGYVKKYDDDFGTSYGFNFRDYYEAYNHGIEEALKLI